jgi:GNAT superfamily N-acetyltransferase
VACSGAVVVGFAAVAPSTDPDLSPDVGELAALIVDPAHQRRGHGSRLLAAAVARLRDLGSGGVVAWVPELDTPRQAFLASAGIAADGARRAFALDDGGRLTEIRLRAALPA